MENELKEQDYIEEEIRPCIKIIIRLISMIISVLSFSVLLLICYFSATQWKIRRLHLNWYVVHNSTRFEMFYHFQIFTNETMLNIFLLLDCIYTLIFHRNTMIKAGMGAMWLEMPVLGARFIHVVSPSGHATGGSGDIDFAIICYASMCKGWCSYRVN